MQALSLTKALSAHITRSTAHGLYCFAAGALLIALVGFAPISAVHNAAHDTRHSAAFPCH